MGPFDEIKRTHKFTKLTELTRQYILELQTVHKNVIIGMIYFTETQSPKVGAKIIQLKKVKFSLD